MKEFITAVEDIAAEDGRQERIDALVAKRQDQIDALVAEGNSPAAAEAVIRAAAEEEVDKGIPVTFMLDKRKMTAFPPDEAQLALLLASLGRGQKKESRFAAILNIMFESLAEDDKDYLENRMLTSNKAEKISMKQIEGIFEYLVEEWFRPSVPDGGTAL